MLLTGRLSVFGEKACIKGNQFSTALTVTLVDLTEEEIRERGHLLSDITFDFNFDNNVEIMPIVKNLNHFNKWVRAYPFYNAVKNEGVELYAA